MDWEQWLERIWDHHIVARGNRTAGVQSIQNWVLRIKADSGNPRRRARWIVGAWATVFLGVIVSAFVHYLDPIWLFAPVIAYCFLIWGLDKWAKQASKLAAVKDPRYLDAFRKLQKTHRPAYYSANLRRQYGNEGTELLNEAARLAMATEGVLLGVGWKYGEYKHQWQQAGLQSIQAMDAGVLKILMLLVDQVHLSEAVPIIQEMRDVYSEVRVLCERKASLEGYSTMEVTQLASSARLVRAINLAENELHNQTVR